VLSDFEQRMNVRKACPHPKWSSKPIEDPLQAMSEFDLPELFAGRCTQGAEVATKSGRVEFRNDVPHIMERCVRCGKPRTRKAK
jgi:hypothetical protein